MTDLAASILEQRQLESVGLGRHTRFEQISLGNPFELAKRPFDGIVLGHWQVRLFEIVVDYHSGRRRPWSVFVYFDDRCVSVRDYESIDAAMVRKHRVVDDVMGWR